MTLREWIEQNDAFKKFEKQIETHIIVMTHQSNVYDETKETLKRLIMISFRDAIQTIRGDERADRDGE